MAFFPRTNSLLQQKAPRASDLLAPEQQQTPEQLAAAGGAPAPDQGLSRGTSNNIAAPGNRAEAGESASDYTKINAQGKGASSRAIFDANKTAEAENATGYGGNLISDAQKALQKEADAYKTATTYAPKIGDADYVDIEANGEKFNNVLNVVQKDPDAYKYAANDQKAHDFVAGMNNELNLRNILKAQNAGSDYSDQSAALDAQLLGSSAGFKNQRDKMVGDYAAYEKNKTDTDTTAKGQLAAHILARDAEKTAVASKLGLAAGAVMTANETKLAEANGARGKEVDAQVFGFQERQRALIQAKIDSLKLDGFSYAPAKSGGNYITGGSREGNINSVVNEKDAARFNKINTLLGKSDRLTSEAGKKTETAFDEEGFKADMEKRYAPAAAARAAEIARRGQAVETERANMSDGPKDHNIWNKGIDAMGDGIRNAGAAIGDSSVGKGFKEAGHAGRDLINNVGDIKPVAAVKSVGASINAGLRSFKMPKKRW